MNSPSSTCSYWNWLCYIRHTIAAMNMSHMTLMMHMEVELELLYGCWWLVLQGLKELLVSVCTVSTSLVSYRFTKNVMPLQIILLCVTCFFVTCQETTPASVTFYETHFHMLRHLFRTLCSVNSSVQYFRWMAEVTDGTLTKFCHIFMFCFITSSLSYAILSVHSSSAHVLSKPCTHAHIHLTRGHHSVMLTIIICGWSQVSLACAKAPIYWHKF